MIEVRWIPMERLRTSFSSLRGPRTDRTEGWADLPLRVMAAKDGTYEV